MGDGFCGLTFGRMAGVVGCGVLAGILLASGRMVVGAETVAASAPAAGAASQAAVPADVEKAMAMPEGKEKAAALSAAAAAWGKVDLDAALSWAVKTKGAPVVSVALVDPPAAEKFFMDKVDRGDFHGTMLRWVGKDTAAATAWCEKECPKDWRYIAFFSLTDGRVKKGDAAGAAAYAAKVDDDLERRAAVHGVAMIMSRGNAAGVAEWAKGLKHEDMKFAATVVASGWWNTSLMPKGAKKGAVKKEDVVKPWLDGLPLSEAEKAEVMAAPAPLSIQKGAGEAVKK